MLEKIDVTSADKGLLDYFEKIYIDSFPECERRQWRQVVDLAAAGKLDLMAVVDNGLPVGFMTIWHFPDFSYIEHFAIDPLMRSRGIGRSVLCRLVSGHEGRKPIVVEVEPPGLEIADRRIDFYRDCGFSLCAGYEYQQPSYGLGLPPVPLMLMTTGNSSSNFLDGVKSHLYTNVYNTDEK